MASIEIDKVTMQSPGSSGLQGFHLDFPRVGEQPDKFSFDIAGWVVGRNAPVRRVEVLDSHEVVRSTEVWMPRPDVADHMARQPAATDAALQAAKTSGFQACVSVVGLLREFELRVEAVLSDDSRAPLGTVRGRKEPVRASFQPRLQPIITSHLGRSGSTWLMHLLGEHPAIVVHRRYPFEACMAVHAVRAFDVLTTPCNPPRAADVDGMRTARDSISSVPLYCRHEDPHMHGWLRGEYVDRFANFTVETMDAFYLEVAATQGKKEAKYFAEKAGFYSGHIAQPLIELCPGTREIFLIRDFRDVTSSAKSFWERPAVPHEIKSIETRIEEQAIRASRLLEEWRARSSRAHLVRYEELVQRPVETLRDLLDYLELDNEPALVEQIIEKTAQTPALENHQTAGGPLRSIGRWRRDMNPAQQALSSELLGSALRAFGYQDGL